MSKEREINLIEAVLNIDLKYNEPFHWIYDTNNVIDIIRNAVNPIEFEIISGVKTYRKHDPRWGVIFIIEFILGDKNEIHITECGNVFMYKGAFIQGLYNPIGVYKILSKNMREFTVYESN